MMTVPIGTDTCFRAQVRWWNKSYVELDCNPVDRDTRFRVTDEDGDLLIDIEVEYEIP